MIRERRAWFYSPITLNVKKIELPIIKKKKSKKKIDNRINPFLFSTSFTVSAVNLSFIFAFQKGHGAQHRLGLYNHFIYSRPDQNNCFIKSTRNINPPMLISFCSKTAFTGHFFSELQKCIQLARFIADAFPQIKCKCKELKKTQPQLENITSIISVWQYIFSFLQDWVI